MAICQHMLIVKFWPQPLANDARIRLPISSSNFPPTTCPNTCACLYHAALLPNIAHRLIACLVSQTVQPTTGPRNGRICTTNKISHDNQGLGSTMVRRSYPNFERRDFIPSENRCHMCFPLPPNMRHYCMHWYANNMLLY